MDYLEVLKIIAEAGSKLETVEIYYPETENTPEGWREVEPYSLRTTTGENGEKLVYGIDEIKPEHIFYGYTVNSDDEHCDGFIIGKIQEARSTGNKFFPRNNWVVEF